MGRTRLVVALVPPSPLLEQLQAFRRLLGDPRVDRIAPHVTLVPPLNVGIDAVDAAVDAVDAAAGDSEPFGLELGPADTFAPTTPTLHLRVGGDVAALARLRDAVARPPLDRVDPRPFVPHVTLRNRLDAEVLPGVVAALRGSGGTWVVDRVVLLEQRPHPAGGASWVPVHEAPFGGPDVVGRGGVELLLRRVGILGPRAAGVLGVEAPAECVPSGRIVVVASTPSEPSEPVAVAAGRIEGSAARLEALVVVPDHRGLGVATQVLASWCSEAARSGCVVAIADADPGFLRARGFTTIGGTAVRAL